MKTRIYFYQNNAYNAIVFDQQNGFYFMTEFSDIDLYADNAIELLKSDFAKAIDNGMMDLSSLCIGDYVFSGDFTADAPEESAELIAEYDDEDYLPYVENLI